MSDTIHDPVGPEAPDFTPIEALDLARRELLEHNPSLGGILPDGLHVGVGFVFKAAVVDGDRLPFVVLATDVPWEDRTRTIWHLHDIDSANTVRVGKQQWSKATGLPVGVSRFAVYDMDPEDVIDPTIPGQVPGLRNLMMAPTEEAAHSLGSWLSDSRQRERVQQWFEVQQPVRKGESDEQRAARIARSHELETYIALREAADRTERGRPSVPGADKWDYEGVKEEATLEVRTDTVLDARAGKMVTRVTPITRRRFEPDHLEWLEAFMLNHGIAVPTDN